MARGAWRLIRDPAGSAAWNMSVDEALLCEVEAAAPVLRFYTWHGPALSFGYRQRVRSLPAAAAGAELVRRVTGGGTVLHAGDLTYAVVAPAGCPDLPDGLEASYRWIQAVLLDGLRRAGIAARPSSPVAGAPRAEICFAAATGSEIEANGAKLAGSAQRRTRWGFLQHGSLRLCDDRSLYAELVGQVPPALGAGLPCAPDDLQEVLADAFRAALGGRLEASQLADGERTRALARQQARTGNTLGVPGLCSRRHVSSADMLP